MPENGLLRKFALKAFELADMDNSKMLSKIEMMQWTQSNTEIKRFLKDHEGSESVDIDKIEALPQIDINCVFNSTLQTFVNYFKIIKENYSEKMREDIHKMETQMKQINLKFLEKRLLNIPTRNSKAFTSSHDLHRLPSTARDSSYLQATRRPTSIVGRRLSVALAQSDSDTKTLLNFKDKIIKEGVMKDRKQKFKLGPVSIEKDAFLPQFFLKKFTCDKGYCM